MILRPIEMGIAKENGTWQTTIVEIPADTADAEICQVATDVLLRSSCVHISGVWVYNSMDDECPEIEDETENAS